MSRQYRNTDQMISDDSRVAELILRGLTHQEIADQLTRETGFPVARRSVSRSVAKIRQEWGNRAISNYDALVNEELERLNLVERALWNIILSSTEEWESVITRLPRRHTETETGSELTDEELEPIDMEDPLVVRKITEITRSGKVDPNIFKLLMENQKERRKLLGLYAPTKAESQVNVTVKGYASKINPDLWPDVIDGTIVEDAPALPSGKRQ